jgi:hypothetical protein
MVLFVQFFPPYMAGTLGSGDAKQPPVHTPVRPPVTRCISEADTERRSVQVTVVALFLLLRMLKHKMHRRLEHRWRETNGASAVAEIRGKPTRMKHCCAGTENIIRSVGLSLRIVSITFMSVRLFVRMYQWRSYSTDLREIWYWGLHFDNKGNSVLRFHGGPQRFTLTAACR